MFGQITDQMFCRKCCRGVCFEIKTEPLRLRKRHVRLKKSRPPSKLLLSNSHLRHRFKICCLEIWGSGVFEKDKNPLNMKVVDIYIYIAHSVHMEDVRYVSVYLYIYF